VVIPSLVAGSNRCRRFSWEQGVVMSQSEAVDFLICAAAHRRGWSIFTTDLDFQNYASVLALRLHFAFTSG